MIIITDVESTSQSSRDRWCTTGYICPESITPEQIVAAQRGEAEEPWEDALAIEAHDDEAAWRHGLEAALAGSGYRLAGTPATVGGMGSWVAAPIEWSQ